MFFEFDGYDQADLDGYAQMTGLPKFTPVLIGGQPGPAHGETVMDLEVAHAIAPPCRPLPGTGPTRKSGSCSSRWIAGFLVRCGACRSDGDAKLF